VVGALAGLGLLLASLGLYSLMAYQVAIDRKELGIRKALGAGDGGLMLRVVARGLAMAAAGVLIGLAAWYRLLPAAGDLLVGADAAGARVPVLVTLLVGASCALATLVPALRATRVEVAVTLKAD
jgi:ABC-type antimicrobial peptide transport system permease subunit